MLSGLMMMFSLSSPAYPIGVCYDGSSAAVASPSILFNVQLALW